MTDINNAATVKGVLRLSATKLRAMLCALCFLTLAPQALVFCQQEQQEQKEDEILLKTLRQIAPILNVDIYIGGGTMQYNLEELEAALGLTGNQRFPRYASMPFEANVRWSLSNGFLSLFYQSARLQTSHNAKSYSVAVENVGAQLGYVFHLIEDAWTLYPFCMGGSNYSLFSASPQTSFANAVSAPPPVLTVGNRNAIFGIGAGTTAYWWRWKRGESFLPFSSLAIGIEVSYVLPVGAERYGVNFLQNISDIPPMSQHGWFIKTLIGARL